MCVRGGGGVGGVGGGYFKIERERGGGREKEMPRHSDSSCTFI